MHFEIHTHKHTQKNSQYMTEWHPVICVLIQNHCIIKPRIFYTKAKHPSGHHLTDDHNILCNDILPRSAHKEQVFALPCSIIHGSALTHSSHDSDHVHQRRNLASVLINTETGLVLFLQIRSILHILLLFMYDAMEII